MEYDAVFSSCGVSAIFPRLCGETTALDSFNHYVTVIHWAFC